MQNILVLGASGNIAKHMIDILVKKDNIYLTLFLRNKHRLRYDGIFKCRIIEGNVLEYNQLKEAVAGQDIVYVNLSGDLEAMAKNIVKVMKETAVKKIIFISSIHIYVVPLRPVLQPCCKATDVNCTETTELQCTSAMHFSIS